MPSKTLSAAHTKLPKGDLASLVAALEIVLAILLAQLASYERRLNDLENL